MEVKKATRSLAVVTATSRPFPRHPNQHKHRFGAQATGSRSAKFAQKSVSNNLGTPQRSRKRFDLVGDGRPIPVALLTELRWLLLRGTPLEGQFGHLSATNDQGVGHDSTLHKSWYAQPSGIPIDCGLTPLISGSDSSVDRRVAIGLWAPMCRRR